MAHQRTHQTRCVQQTVQMAGLLLCQRSLQKQGSFAIHKLGMQGGDEMKLVCFFTRPTVQVIQHISSAPAGPWDTAAAPPPALPNTCTASRK